MKRIIPWLGLGLIAAAFGGSTFACSSSDSGGSSGAGGGTGGSVIGGAGGTEGGIGGSGGTVGGSGGTGGSTTVRLGRACATDAECGQGLTCLKDGGKLDGDDPAKGYCTVDCSTDNAVCDQFDTNSVCLQYDNGSAFCMEGCTFGPQGLQQFDPKKCHGREEVACRPLFDEGGNFTVAACLPQCNSDADCGSGKTCNPRTGGCGTTVTTGKAVGEPCVQDLEGGTNECKGICIGFVHDSGDDPFTYMCAENCTAGASPSCGWGGPGSGPATAACLFTSTVIIDKGGPGLGDFGSCGQLCDCNADCKNPDLVCRAWTGANASQLVSFFSRQGFCSDPLNDDGGTDPGIATCGGTDAGTGGTGGTSGDAGTD